MQKKARFVSVILIDNDIHFRRQVKAWLREDPIFRCTGSYGDGKTALEEVSLIKPDVAIVSFDLPSLKGDEVTRRLKRHRPVIKVIVVADTSDERTIFDSLDAGADGFADKPVNEGMIVAQLRVLIAGGVPLSESARQLFIRQLRKFRIRREEVSGLTEREREVAELSCHGFSDQAIAQKLGVSVWTVRTHQRNIHHKLDIHCRAELQLRLFQMDCTDSGRPQCADEQ